MKKIVIIGSPGAGKSTFARTLGSLLKINVIHLDRLFWLAGWKRKPWDKRKEILQGLVQEKQWIIEGTYLRLFEPRLIAADTIIFLDIAPWRCLWRILKRHYIYHKRPRPDIPEGCADILMLSLVRWVLLFPFQDRKKLMQELKKHKSKEIIYLRSPKEVENFLAQQRQTHTFFCGDSHETDKETDFGSDAMCESPSLLIGSR